MNLPMLLVEAILAGFFAVACIRAAVRRRQGTSSDSAICCGFPGE